MKRIRKSDHSPEKPEKKVRLQAIRDHFQIERPSWDELVAPGEYTEPVPHGVTLDAMHIGALLKQARQEADLSLAAVAKRCGLDRATISRLENGLYENTTLTTLHRLARAYGKRFLVQLVNDG